MEFNFKSASCRLVVHSPNAADISYVYSKVRGQGHATGLLTEVCKYADENDLDIFLLARGYGGPVQTMLNPE